MEFIDMREGVYNYLVKLDSGLNTSVGTITLTEGRFVFKGSNVPLTTSYSYLIHQELVRRNNLKEYSP